MLSIRIDQFEFEDPGSEESLEIDVSRRSKFPHPDVDAFVEAAIGVQAASTLPEPSHFYRYSGRHQASEYIKRFAHIDIPLHADWPTYILSTLDQIHLVICSPEQFIRYQWSTSA